MREKHGNDGSGGSVANGGSAVDGGSRGAGDAAAAAGGPSGPSSPSGPSGPAGLPGPSGVVGLRERKRLRMYRDVSETAIALFLERGFDAVSVAEVAAAAEISKPTLFRYFPTKEDLVLHRFADHETEPARLVAARAEGTSPVAALRARFLDGLDHRDPVTGLNDAPAVLDFHRLLYGTPALAARLHGYLERSEAALASALGGGLDARLAAAQIIAVQRVLALENWRRMAAGERADDVHGEAVEAAQRAFGRLGEGLGGFGGPR